MGSVQLLHCLGSLWLLSRQLLFPLDVPIDDVVVTLTSCMTSTLTINYNNMVLWLMYVHRIKPTKLSSLDFIDIEATAVMLNEALF